MNVQNGNKLQLMYVFPNLFTAASAFLGVISVIASANAQFDKAAIYILLSLIFDGLDGRVARLTNATSKFGAEFDSLADIVAFGVAPAMLFYFSIAHAYGKVGSLLCAMFVVFGAIRLARFNVMIGTVEPSVFIGVPIPTAAVVVAMWILFYKEYPAIHGYESLMLFGLGGLSCLMVSNIRYPSFKKIDLKKGHLIKTLVYLVATFSLLYLYPIEVGTLLISLYLVYGLLRGVYTFIVAKYYKN
ncbi:MULTISPECIES: CDP-diacylglycerol--serine O-phosphatidyltransferase [Sulfurospirillum]|jgi:CDP-diacylglycerol--serine O-phosphatidyltransferase|uniref:CDP-diacylglycerol--serine O-phosphatidyltransferase n=1 Tax=Sulfurospirillum TaxID=57665 RepID=UPI000543765E|nr:MULTISPECIES: CDP-diacylglycerol--serine O-phosphatidyltransferase [Sulfurospirillum]KHG33784.1 MAG: CDP-diacylglycerol--serine O-phosphatidyltransferase [Sulfurospirillum sp. MES]MCD8543542.1 CDP-diacylglycerol--serine O-phosphatidyltransferase [Sulfurospirillum cavolei]MCP3653155.1 CDP-diacylglycerol--serine O-phosphatidyltransferase [Sulfurospirillum sp. DNRA8]MCR1812006.1 CDP-diacylglycerol--serine O-phosphatidyltransferase [Sulfurospirillum sp. DNRA8]